MSLDPQWLTVSDARAMLEYDQLTGLFRWRVARNGAIRVGMLAGQVLASGYRSIAIRRRGFLEHRLAWFMVHGEWPTGEVDHINRDRTDNRLANLRVVSRSQNMHNTVRRKAPRDGESGLFKKGNRWGARISFQGEEIYLGAHEDKDVMRLTRALAKDRALKGLRPMAASERRFIEVDEDESAVSTGEITEHA